MMKKATIYTGNGDKGTTSLIGGAQVPKDHPRVEAYGTLDELTAQLGLLAISMEKNAQRDTIEQIENNLLAIASALANPANNSPVIKTESIKAIEQEIDAIESQLHPLRCFILPSDIYASAQANLCRTICRRAERRIVALSHNNNIHPEILTYINRISDYLFTLSRLLANGAEKKWENPCK